MGLESFRHKRSGRDVEAADFDEAELDELHVQTPEDEMAREQYSVGSASDEEDEGYMKNGRSNGKARER